MKATYAVSVLFLSSLYGCAVGPNYQAPRPQLPEAWNSLKITPPDKATDAHAAVTSLTSDRATSPVLAGWWTTFNDATLNSLIGRALESNLDFQQAQTRVVEARAMRGIVRADQLPQFDAATSYSHNRLSKNIFPISFGGTANTGAPSPFGFIVGKDFNLFNSGFDANWELDVFGGTRRRVEASNAELQASLENARAAQVTLLSEVSRNYIELRAYQALVRINRSNLQTQQETHDLIKQKYEAGVSTELDLTRTDAQVAETDSALPSLETAIAQSIHRLSVLLGQEPGALQSELEPTAALPELPPHVPVGLPSDLLRRRPDIRRAERELAAANARIGAAIADYFPRFSLTGAIGLESMEMSTWLHNASKDWATGPTIVWPIFQGGRIRQNIRLQNAREQEALEKYRQTVLIAMQEVEDALVAFQKEQGRRQSLADAAAANRKSVELAHKLYNDGVVDFLNVLDAQSRQYASEDALARSDAALRTDLIALYKSLGGGWEAADAPPAQRCSASPASAAIKGEGQR